MTMSRTPTWPGDAAGPGSGASPCLDAPVDRDPRVTVVVLTHNRCDELMDTLRRLSELPERPALIVVDNASTDGTPAEVLRRFPQVDLVRLPRNRGAAGRNAGIERARTRFVACCDDDCWWAPGALAAAADLLDCYPRLGAVAPRLRVEPQGRDDPTCELMAQSPLPARGLPGPALIGFMAGAVVLRREAFLEAGGYEPQLFLGAEERLLGLDLAALRWHMAYVPELLAHHHPSVRRDVRSRRVLLARNRIWIAWLRLPARSALDETLAALGEASAGGCGVTAAIEALAGLPWALAHRRVVPPGVEQMRQQVLGAPRRWRWPWPGRPAPR